MWEVSDSEIADRVAKKGWLQKRKKALAEMMSSMREDWREFDEARGAKRLADLKKIVNDKQHGKVDGHPMDLYSAAAILAVHNELSPENRKKFLAMPVPKMHEATFKLLASQSKETAESMREDWSEFDNERAAAAYKRSGAKSAMTTFHDPITQRGYMMVRIGGFSNDKQVASFQNDMKRLGYPTYAGHNLSGRFVDVSHSKVIGTQLRLPMESMREDWTAFDAARSSGRVKYQTGPKNKKFGGWYRHTKVLVDGKNIGTIQDRSRGQTTTLSPDHKTAVMGRDENWLMKNYGPQAKQREAEIGSPSWRTPSDKEEQSSTDVDRAISLDKTGGHWVTVGNHHFWMKDFQSARNLVKAPSKDKAEALMAAQMLTSKGASMSDVQGPTVQDAAKHLSDNGVVAVERVVQGQEKGTGDLVYTAHAKMEQAPEPTAKPGDVAGQPRGQQPVVPQQDVRAGGLPRPAAGTGSALPSTAGLAGMARQKFQKPGQRGGGGVHIHLAGESMREKGPSHTHVRGHGGEKHTFIRQTDRPDMPKPGKMLKRKPWQKIGIDEALPWDGPHGVSGQDKSLTAREAMRDAGNVIALREDWKPWDDMRRTVTGKKSTRAPEDIKTSYVPGKSGDVLRYSAGGKPHLSTVGGKTVKVSGWEKEREGRGRKAAEIR